MTHTRQIIPLSKSNIEMCEKLLGVDLVPLLKAGGSFFKEKSDWTVFLLVQQPRSSAYSLHAVLFYSDFGNPMIDAALANNPERPFRVIVAQEGVLSNAYDLIPEEKQP